MIRDPQYTINRSTVWEFKAQSFRGICGGDFYLDLTRKEEWVCGKKETISMETGIQHTFNITMYLDWKKTMRLFVQN